jgi:hypothetical protein
MYRVRFGSATGNKYYAKKQEYGGKKYDSRKEAAYAFELDLRLKAGDIAAWDRQKRISLDVNGRHICNYICDFLITHNDGTLEYVEVKSKFTYNMDVYQLKRKLMEATFLDQNPDIKYTVVI